MNEQLDERLSAYLDGELDSAETAEIEALLASSEQARNELQVVTEARDMVRGLPLLTPPPDIERMFRSGSPLAPVRSVRPVHTRARAMDISAVATAAFLGVVLGTNGFSASVSPSIDSVVAAHTSALPNPAGLILSNGDAGDMPMPAEPAGMTLVHVDHQGNVRHAKYTDGVQEVSVFAEPGRVDWDAMPPGDRFELNGRPAWHGSSDGYDVVVLQRGRNVFTIVAEASEEMMDMGESMTTDEATSVSDRLSDAADSLVQVFGLRG